MPTYLVCRYFKNVRELYYYVEPEHSNSFIAKACREMGYGFADREKAVEKAKEMAVKHKAEYLENYIFGEQ